MLAAVAAVVLTPLVSLSSSSLANGTTTYPTLAQIYSDVAASVAITHTPNPSTTVPKVASLNPNDASLSPQRNGCWVNSTTIAVPSNVSTYCAYGDLSSTKVLLLTGDSQAGMWLPALDAMGTQLGYKVIFLAMRECSAWGTPNRGTFILFKNVTVAECDNRNRNVARWAVATKPAAVIMSGRGYPKGYNIDVRPVITALEAEMNSEVNALKASGSKLIVIGPIPRYDTANTIYQPTDCLDGAEPFTKCQLAPSKLLPATEIAAEAYEVAQHHFVVAKVSGLMCTSTKCTIVVKDTSGVHLVFYDGAHINSFYSAWISAGLGSILTPLLPV